MTAKLHIRALDDEAELGHTLCNRWAALIDDDAPTCLVCVKLRDAATRPEYTRRITWDEALASLMHVLAGPRVEPYPAVTPDTYGTMHCRRGDMLTPAAYERDRTDGLDPSKHRICRCVFCIIDARDRKAHDEWYQEQQLRPHRRHGHPFGSYTAALHLALHWRRNGAAVRSSLGSMQSRAEESAKLGTHVQTTLRTDRDSLEVRRVIEVADVEAAVRRAFADEASRRGLTADQCFEIALRMVDAEQPVTAEEWASRTGLTLRAVHSLLRHARRAIQIELAATGKTPDPRDTRLGREIVRRRAEIVAMEGT